MYSQDLKSESNDSSPSVGEVASSVEVVETSDKAGVWTCYWGERSFALSWCLLFVWFRFWFVSYLQHIHAAQSFGFYFVLLCLSYNGILKACCVFIDPANACSFRKPRNGSVCELPSRFQSHSYTVGPLLGFTAFWADCHRCLADIQYVPRDTFSWAPEETDACLWPSVCSVVASLTDL